MKRSLESGNALVEFVLVVPLITALLLGVINFAVALCEKVF